MEQNQYGFFKNAVIDQDGALLVSATSTGFTSDLTSVLSEGNTTEGQNIVLSAGDGSTTDVITTETGNKWIFLDDTLGFGVKVDNNNNDADYSGSIGIDRGSDGGTASGVWNLTDKVTNNGVALQLEPNTIRLINDVAASDITTTITASNTSFELVAADNSIGENVNIGGYLSNGNGQAIISYTDGINSSNMYFRNDGITIDTLAIIIDYLPTSSSGLTSNQLFTRTAAQLGGSGSTKVICIV